MSQFVAKRRSPRIQTRQLTECQRRNILRTNLAKGNAMSQKGFSAVAGAIFLVIALIHVLRLFLGWEAVLNGRAMPMWVSWVALLLAGYLGYEGLRLSRRS